MRNEEIHGTNIKQSHKRRTRTIQIAKELFQQGPDSVPIPQHRLFHRFESLLERPTRTIEHWIDTIQVAQQCQKEIMISSQSQPNLFQFQIIITPTANNQSNPQSLHSSKNNRNLRSTSQLSTLRDKWSQQDIRRLLLCTNPNVRYRKS